MLDRINKCNSCPTRDYCEFFSPGEWCYLDEQTTIMFNGREGSFRIKLKLLTSCVMRDFGHGVDERRDKIFKEIDGLMDELPEYKKIKAKLKEADKDAGLQESGSMEKSP